MNGIVDKIFELSINLIESFIIIDFVSSFLGYKYAQVKKVIGFAAGVSVYFIYISILNSIMAFEGIGVLISMLLIFGYCIIYTKGTALSKLFVSAATFITILVINMIVLTLVSSITQLDIIELISELSSARYVTVIITKILFFFATRVLLIFKNKEKFSLSNIEWISLIFINVISISIGIFIIEIIFKSPNLEKKNLFVLLSMLGILGINIITYYLLLKLSRDNNQKLKYTILEQEYKYQKKYNDDIKEFYKDISKLKHDMKNHLTCIMAMINFDEKEDAISYIQKIIEQKIDIVPRYVETDNEAANNILNCKLAICKDLNIDTKCFINCSLNKISEIDICILLGNIIDNAIEACVNCELPKITIDIRNTGNYIQILIGNTISCSVLTTNPMLISQKKDKKQHGYGIQNIKEIVSNYNGLIDYYEKNNMIFCDIMINS